MDFKQEEKPDYRSKGLDYSNKTEKDEGQLTPQDAAVKIKPYL